MTETKARAGAMQAMPNCWEHFDCGSEPGGENVGELGVCPASIATFADGLNRGQAGGRICWAIAGTFCDGVVQGTEALEKEACHQCSFLELVQDQEGRFDFQLWPGFSQRPDDWLEKKEKSTSVTYSPPDD